MFDNLLLYVAAIDNWFVSPCENNGTCVNWIGGFNCTCTEDYSGTRCEIGNETDKGVIKI